MPAIYQSKYGNSWALVVGINSYKNASPLLHARSDAESVARMLSEQFGFLEPNIALLLDDEATKETIMESFLRYADGDTTDDDRLLVFFAGHGHTVTGKYGEVGYLVPQDGDPRRLVTLLRWDELTRNAELISAKHVFFIMDACYGGLAIARSLQAGSTRFVKDMLSRYSRQVLTAGKADEVVSDAGGPLPDHSVFTGYLLQGLHGEAASTDGVITANAVMAYVYEKVSRHPHSHQTPHYGFLDGDGDFIFNTSVLQTLEKIEGSTADLMIEVPASQDTSIEKGKTVIAQAKTFLSDPTKKIALDDLLVVELRHLIQRISTEEFAAPTGPIDADTLAGRLREYETATRDVLAIGTLASRWGTGQHSPTIRTSLERVVEPASEPQGGKKLWLALRWYPAMLCLYSCGIASIAGQNWPALATLFSAKTQPFYRDSGSRVELVLSLGGVHLAVHDAFKMIPGYEQHYVPRSEYLFKRLQPLLDDLLFLGKSYEICFDRFEVLFAMAYAHLDTENDYIWGPLGRFAWKYRQRSRYRKTDPMTQLIEEASSQGHAWGPFQVGLFGGSPERFRELAQGLSELINKLSWL